MDELFSLLYVYVKGAWKYRWISVIVAWIIAIAGWMSVYKMPDNFQASARIYVDTENILSPLMAGMTVTPNAQRKVAIMSRTLINRPNIERIIRMVDLDITITNDAARENLITSLMGKIKLDAAGGDNIFTISFNNKDPILAKDVVQSLLTIFVEEGLGGEKEESSSAMRFIDQQIAAYEQKLIAAETLLTAFKQKNVGLLPGSGGNFYDQLITAQGLLDVAELALNEAKSARDSFKQQITGDEPVFVLEPFNEPNVTAVKITNPVLDARINSLNENLDELRLNFTEIHPDIVSAKRLISRLEERKIEEAEAELLVPGVSSDLGINFSPMLQQLNIALTESEALVASMEVRVTKYTNDYNQLKSMSEATPRVEAEFVQLNRDYQANRSNYEQLLERRISAEMSGELTATSGLLSFRIIDPPTVPELPDGPDRGLFFTIVLIAALGIGVGAAFIASQIRPAFHSQSSLNETTGIRVLGTVPMIWTTLEKKKRIRRLYMFGFTILILVMIYTLLIIDDKEPGLLLSKLPF